MAIDPITTTMLSLPDGRQSHLLTAGPETARPGVVLLHGLGGSSFEWVAAIRHFAAERWRVVMADRAGYHPSSPPAEDVKPTLPWIAAELKLVLETAKVSAPYILVGQSYGGDIARQCMLDWPAELIAGMVVVDSPVLRCATDVPYAKLLGGADYGDVVGLSANMKLTPEEKRTMLEVDAKNEEIAGREMASAVADGATQRSNINGRRLLGDKPLSVVYCGTANDFQKIYDHGIEHGHGDAEARKAMESCLAVMAESDEKYMREMLGYSSQARFVRAEGVAATHNVHLVDHETIAREIGWVMDGGK